MAELGHYWSEMQRLTNIKSKHNVYWYTSTNIFQKFIIMW